ncbi:MAG: beta-lactamase family protein [Bauldia sp.]|nr:beta-lactamase family protein [Bauldia sp.]
MVRAIGYGKCGAAMFLMLLAGCSDLGDLATLPMRTEPAAMPSTRAPSTEGRFAATADASAAVARAALVDQNLPGLSIAVAVGAEIVWAEGFGWSDLERGETVTPDTRFRVGDLGVPLTAAAAGLLVERGVLDLDAPIQTYIAFPQKQWPLTARQLMGATSGIRDLAFEEEWMRQVACRDDTGRLSIFADDPLRFEPGTASAYSAYGWIVLGAIIGAVSGEPYADFMAREVLRPLGMADTVPDQAAGQRAPGVATFYYPTFMMRTRQGLETATRVDVSCVLPADGYLSTPSDLARFAGALAGGALLRPETLSVLQSPVVLPDGTVTGETLGWEVGTIRGSSGRPVRTIGREGDVFGGTASLLTLLAEGITVVVATNVSFGDTATIAAEIARLFAATK